MVKGTSRQVIVVNSPDPKLFEQAIFLIKEDALRQGGVTDETLIKEARRLISESAARRGRKLFWYGPVWACCGALLTGIAWLVTTVL